MNSYDNTRPVRTLLYTALGLQILYVILSILVVSGRKTLVGLFYSYFDYSDITFPVPWGNMIVMFVSLILFVLLFVFMLRSLTAGGNSVTVLTVLTVIYAGLDVWIIPSFLSILQNWMMGMLVDTRTFTVFNIITNLFAYTAPVCQTSIVLLLCAAAMNWYRVRMERGGFL